MRQYGGVGTGAAWRAPAASPGVDASWLQLTLALAECDSVVWPKLLKFQERSKKKKKKSIFYVKSLNLEMLATISIRKKNWTKGHASQTKHIWEPDGASRPCMRDLWVLIS